MATTITPQKYRAFIATLRRILLYPGLWPVAQPSLFYRLLPTLMSLSCFITSCAILNFVRLHHTNIPNITRGLSSALTISTAGFKILFLNPNRKCVQALHKTLDLITDELLNDISVDSLVSKKFITVRRILNIFIYFVGAPVSTFTIFPMLFILIQYFKHANPIKYLLVNLEEYPWPIAGGSALYFCHYALDVVTSISTFCATSGVDTLFGICVFLMSGKLRLMSHRLNASKSDANYDTLVQECLTSYEMLLKCRDNIEKIYGPTILWMVLTSAMVLCGNIYQVSRLNSISIGVFALSSCARLIETFIYTWFGSMFTSESEMFRQAIYATNWPVTNQKRFMSSILIMLTQKPLVITSCGCVAISIDIFTKIVNTTLSYYFLLKTLEGT